MLMNSSLDNTSSFLTCSPWTLVLPSTPNSFEMPALLTAAEMALTADWMDVRSWVRSPCADGYLRCSDRKNLVIVMQLVSIGCSAILM